jgi:VanZ family protein
MILDAVLNVFFYIPIGAAAFLSLRRGFTALFAAFGFGALLSLGIEWTQLFIPFRVGNLTDLFFNASGTFIGAVAAFAVTSPPPAVRLRGLYPPGVLLLGLWLAWQASLLLPQYKPPIDVSHELLGLLMVTLLLARRRAPVTAVLLLIWLAADELRPFRFRGPPQVFWWLPFESWFQGAPESYYAIFFQKLFFYTAILWVERTSGMKWAGALAAPAAILFAGELAQLYLPGRTPEITDVVLLLAGAVMLSLAEPSHWDNRCKP